MSDSEGGISDDLLELAGASERKRKKTQGSSKRVSKKPRATLSDSDDGIESEEDATALYPLQGKFKDVEDMQRLMALPELQREEILSERMEEMQKILDARNLQRMLKASTGGDEDGAVSKAAKREHATRGGNKDKNKKLDELKARRKAKGDRSLNKSPSHEYKDESSDDMDMSSDEEEDGQITKHSWDDEADTKPRAVREDKETQVDVDTMNRCRLTREMVSRHSTSPWFEEFVVGSWVRYLLDGNKNIYRICEVMSMVKAKNTYKIDDKRVDQDVELRHGKSTRIFSMSMISNSPFTQHEFDRWKAQCQADSIRLPSQEAILKKHEDRKKLAATPLTDAQISAMLARKVELSAQPTAASLTLERSRLNAERALAVKRSDWDEVRSIDDRIAALPAARREEDVSDINSKLAAVNERNRKANLEAIRKAESMEAERKRKERKLLASAGSGANTPIKSHDPSARLKTVPKTFNANNSNANLGTSSGNGENVGAKEVASAAQLPVSAMSVPLKAAASREAFETSIIDSVDVDLGDF